MDGAWKTPKWRWDVDRDDEKKIKVGVFKCHPEGEAIAVQVSREKGSSAIVQFDRTVHSRTVKTKEDWDTYLNLVPQPGASTLEASLSVVICPRHVDKQPIKGVVRNSQNLAHVPVPSAGTFRGLMETFHIHQSSSTIVNRGWPIIIRSEDSSGPDRKIYYTLRSTNLLSHDTLLTVTYFPHLNHTYALFLGFSPNQVSTILSRLSFSAHAVFSPLTLINTFLQLEKVHRFEQVERHADLLAKMVANFQDEAVGVRGKGGRPVPEDDPRDLVGLAAEMRLLRGGLLGWGKEMERFKGRVEGEGDFENVLSVGNGPGSIRLPLLDAGEYLERTVDEYASMVRMCEGMLEQVSMTFQMETSSIARQEVNKMKALAILTMVFLPATFVATFMSMGLFEWHPDEGKEVVSKYWYIYFVVTGGLTGLVFLMYLYWSRFTAWSIKAEKTNRNMV